MLQLFRLHTERGIFMQKRFISATKDYTTLETHVPAPYLRRSFTLDGKPTEAKISISGLGFYILFVNGERVSKGQIAPYISNPDHICYYDTFDIADKLTAGENVIGVILGNGMLNCPGGYVWTLTMRTIAPHRCSLLSLTAVPRAASFRSPRTPNL